MPENDFAKILSERKKTFDNKLKPILNEINEIVDKIRNKEKFKVKLGVGSIEIPEKTNIGNTTLPDSIDLFNEYSVFYNKDGKKVNRVFKRIYNEITNHFLFPALSGIVIIIHNDLIDL